MSRSNAVVCSALPGSLIVYVPPFMGPPTLVILKVADRSLLQATPKPKYGSGCEGVFVGVGVGVNVLVAVPVNVAVMAGVLVGVDVDESLAQVASALATPVPG